MNHTKILGLAAIVAAALMALIGAGSASATTLTAPDGTTLAAGSLITAEAEGTVTLHPPFGDITCEKSHVEGKTSNTGSTSETVKGNISTLSFTSCNATVTVVKTGSLEIHTQETKANNNGTLTSSGTEVTVEFIGTHCIFATEQHRRRCGHRFDNYQNRTRYIRHLRDDPADRW